MDRDLKNAMKMCKLFANVFTASSCLIGAWIKGRELQRDGFELKIFSKLFNKT